MKTIQQIDSRIRSWVHGLHDDVGYPFQLLIRSRVPGEWIRNNTEPNHWTVLRFPLTLIIATCLFLGLDLAAIIVYILSILTDRFDGELARETGRQSSFGSLLDTIADSVLQSAVLLSLAKRYPPVWTAHPHLTLPVFAVALEVVRLIGGLILQVMPGMADRQHALRPNMSGKFKMAALAFSVVAILTHQQHLAQQFIVTALILGPYSMARHLVDAQTTTPFDAKLH